jgi:cytochrome c-type biogenesis protein CcmF
MNNALGLAGISLGLVACVAGIVSQLIGLKGGRPQRLVHSRGFALMAFLGALVAAGAMERALITNDTTVRYVAEQSSKLTPFPFKEATMWGALEGSILLWALILGGYTLTVAWKFRKRLTDPLVGWAMLVLFAIASFFFALMLGPARPFQVFHPPTPNYDGPGPNELLQNHILMAFHPPMLYLGYVGFSVPFAFAIAALITGRVGEGWLVETRRWTLFAWGFLTAGIILGAWWSYEVLGWGGYWAWDPVENASFLPWLCGTAYLHSVMVQERRGMLRVWNLTLLCATFSLTILGTFLTRSGVVESVHAFSNSSIGPLLLGFFGLTVAVSVALIGWRGDRLRSPGRIDSPVSREGAFFANNLLFAAFAFVVLLGTVFPLLVEAVNNNKISVGAPFFDRMAMPIGIALLALMAIAPVLPWRASNAEVLSQRLFWPAVAGVGVLVVAFAAGARGFWPLLAFALGGVAAGSAVRQLVLATRRNGWRGLLGRANGGMIVHIGVIMVAIALASSQAYVREGEFTLKLGQRAQVDGHTVQFLGMRTVDEPNRREVRSRILIDDQQVYEPRINQYKRTGREIGTPAVDTNFTGDVYLSLQHYPTDSDPSIGLRVLVEPLIMWLWVGGFVMVFGTALAAFPGRRRRNPLDPVSQPPVERELVGAP